VKTLFVFLIALAAGTALFAVPATGKGALSAFNTAAAVPHRADALTAVTDVSPIISPAENLRVFDPVFDPVLTSGYALAGTRKTMKDGFLYHKEARPLSGRSKPADAQMSDDNYARLLFGYKK
jgi:hypothetical protein